MGFLMTLVYFELGPNRKGLKQQIYLKIIWFTISQDLNAAFLCFSAAPADITNN